MVSLLIVRSAGSVVSQCDAVCYNARHTECVCAACGGVNHGVGLEQAITNTRRLHVEWLERVTAEHADVTVELDIRVQQLPLFPMEFPCP
ncbi:hypothetical protein GCM10023085_44450 [Actinomadura viridis]|uniref:Uncharacterized protein n=1 Tax=Actinomadura viridis TaxID=58110 RepID=A0A931GK14_9ACTN|nr:hypothetical protein [Actinomadura viridis]MBG6089807.1 hypothetical protein [Actinomadura viridis]